MAVQVLGKVAYFNKGAYNSQTNYEINDVVSYNGSSYVSLNNNNQGNLPTNTNYWSVVAEKGDKGDTGKPFVIEKTYSTIENMVADYDNMNVNDYVMIQGSIEEQENATLWTKREVEVSPYKWAYLADFSGASGITGATPNIHIGTVTEGNEPSVTRRSGSSNENPILDFVLKTGAKGDTGATGNGISGIQKTSTSGLTDTYTISFTDGTSTDIDVTNGRSIVSILKTSTVGKVDTYTITYNDGTTSTFDVTNGEVTEEEFNEVVEELNYLYDDLPTIDEEGTTLILDNTRKGKMGVVLKGNSDNDTSVTGNNRISIYGKNMFNKNGVLTSGYIRPDGSISSSANFEYTDYIPIKPSTLYTTTGILGGTGDEPSRAYYDIDKNFISGYRHSNQAIISDTSPSNAYFMIESVRRTDLETIQIEKGAGTPYEAYQDQSYPINLGSTQLNNADVISGDIDNWQIVRADSTIETITDTTLVTQLNDLKDAMSNNTQTNIIQTNTANPFIISASAYISLKYLFNNLDSRVATLES